MRKSSGILGLAIRGALLFGTAALAAETRSNTGIDSLCQRSVTARVVALDQPFFFNRLGAHQPGGMVYALERDVVSTVWGQPAMRWSGIHIVGLSLVRTFDGDGQPLEGIQADGTWVGANAPGIVPPGGKITYVYKADALGSYLLHSMPGNFGFEQESGTFNLQYPQGQMTAGLFGAVGEDRYAINYGSGGIGSELLANRFQVGPAGGCTACKYEEFFLSSWPNGDPAQVVTMPTTAAAALKLPAQPLQKVLYPDDPSNV